MPIYAYRCEDCSFTKDILQKLSDNPLTVCPACGKETFKKLLSAPSVHAKSGASDAAANPCGCCCAAGPGGMPCCG